MSRGLEVGAELDDPIDADGLVVFVEPEGLEVLSWDEKGAREDDESGELNEIYYSLVQLVAEIVFSDGEYHQRQHKVNQPHNWLTPDLHQYTQPTEQKVHRGS